MVSIVLVGAGASFGSEDVHPTTPPLGNQLFDKLEQAGGIAARIPTTMKYVFRENFEAGMALYYKYYDGNIMQFQRELAQYLVQFSPGPRNTYIRLIKTLGIHKIIYCSLNYDLLLELSAGSLGFNTTYDSKSIKNCIRILKPHGSSNFWPDIPIGMLRNVTIKESGRADIQADIRPLSQLDTLHRCQNEDSVAPAIAMFAEGKAVKISPDYVEMQQHHWATSANTATQIFVVGVRVHTIDEHIWGILANTKAKVTYFGFPNDQHSFNDWKLSNNKKNAYFINANFSECISTIKSRLN